MKTGPLPRPGGRDDVIAGFLSCPHRSLTDRTAVAPPPTKHSPGPGSPAGRRPAPGPGSVCAAKGFPPRCTEGGATCCGVGDMKRSRAANRNLIIRGANLRVRPTATFPGTARSECRVKRRLCLQDRDLGGERPCCGAGDLPDGRREVNKPTGCATRTPLSRSHDLGWSNHLFGDR